MNIAIITGASSGMGKEFALRISETANIEEMWLIARREDKLKMLASQLKIPCRVLPMDLTKEESLSELKNLLSQENPVVKVLVNAGGYGKFGAFNDIPIEEQMGMIDLNCKALTQITYFVLPYTEKGSQIYQLGSLSAFQPVPYIGVYGAGKAYVLSFSRALNRELKRKGIRVMAVCPGWVKTEFFDRAVRDDTISYYNRFYTAEQVVKRALRDMKKGKDVSICGIAVRMQVRATKLLPHKLVMAIWCKQQRKT
ncbi:MAG: SDR family NAD(P)-dependent oxidoreductase [Ruminococcaceae bacterium]|nr:SDR family NAD(P)-dependent oxidoreductase [Oscillospiraceae bacterium]